MNEPLITTDQAAACLGILKRADKFLTAAEIAAYLKTGGCHETQRRYVRAIIKHLRDDGAWIIANNADGYFLTADPKIWDDYVNKRAIDAKVMLAECSSRKKLIDKNGQGVLFESRVPMGVATMGT